MPTIEEITTALSNDQALQQQFIQTFPTLPFGKTYIENTNKNYLEQNLDTHLGKKVGEVHGGYDRDFKEVLGVDKPDGVKSYVFWKEKVSELKAKADLADPAKYAEYQNKIKDLETKIASGGSDAVLQEQYKTLQGKYQTDLQEREAKIAELNNKIQHGSVYNSLNGALSKLKINTDLPKGVTDNFIQQRMNKIISEAKFNDAGEIVFYKDGAPKLNAMAEKISAEEFLAMELEEVIAKDRQQAGGGAGAGSAAAAGAAGSYTNLSSAKTRMELTDLVHKQLISEGLAKGTNDYVKKEAALVKQYGIDKNLPLR